MPLAALSLLLPQNTLVDGSFPHLPRVLRGLQLLAVAWPGLTTVQGDFNPKAHDLLHLPKILGVDFMLDDDLRVWLLEVRRPAVDTYL